MAEQYVEFEQIQCNGCGNRKARRLFSVPRYDKDFVITKCDNCGLVYVNPRPTREQLMDYYTKVYDHDSFFEAADSIKKRCREDLNLISKYKQSGRLLEIGCMYGFLLELARQSGYEPYGVEISKQTSDYARDVLGLNVFNGPLENRGFEDGFFDVIFLSHLIEHLENPMETLKLINHIIKDEGVLILRCPNFISLMSRLTGKSWWWLAPPEHLYHFSPKTIRIILNKTGFNRVESTTTHGDLRYLRYLGVCLIEALPLPQKMKISYRVLIDNTPKHFSQQIFSILYKLAWPIIKLIHKVGMGEEMIVIAQK